MAVLKVFAQDNSEKFDLYTEYAQIVEQLARVGIRYEIWKPEVDLPKEAQSVEILEAFKKSIEKLSQERGFKTADVMALTENHPQKAVLRQKFLAEHVHSDDEARYFVDGQGLFYVHINNQVLSILCQKGDLINVPAGTKHWFDMGEHPHFKCIRVFTNEEGWVAQFTGNSIATSFPPLQTNRAANS